MHVYYTSPPSCFSLGPDLLLFAADLLGMEGGKLGALQFYGYGTLYQLDMMTAS